MDKPKYDNARDNEEKAYLREQDLLRSKNGELSSADKLILSRLFEKAAQSHLGTENPIENQIVKAIGLYQRAEMYSPYQNVKARIGKNIEKLQILKLSHKQSLEKKLTGNIPAILSIAFLTSALFFTSSSLTGNVVLGFGENNLRFIGTGFFIAGLICAFVFLKGKMKNKKKKSKK
ncbi:Uncharacterised protein [uncultured archaeon]|nr:Uncharacterised protein [uncultured archaeon]